MSGEERFLDQKVLKIINDYLKKNDHPDTPVTKYLYPHEIREKIDLAISKEGCSIDDLYKAIQDYLETSVRTGHKQYFNQLWAGYTLPGLLGDIFTSLTNTSMYTYEVAPVATLIERFLVEKMGHIVGFKKPEGIFVTGGSHGNLMAMMIARNNAFPDIKREGLKAEQTLTAFVSDQAHYSFEKAANILGVGSQNVVKVKTDDAGRMIPEELDKIIRSYQEQGKAPFFVGLTAGTTVKGAYDPVDEIEPIARKYRLWLHVDGSLGGSVVLSPRHRHLMKGCEEANSLIWNPHKMMGLPLICSVFLVKEEGYLRNTFSTSGTEYIFHDHDFAAHDLGPLSMQCGRKVDALKLWLSWKFYGDNGYAERMDKFFDLAAHAEDKVNSLEELELMAPRNSVTVCFRYLPRSTEDINAFNLRLREELAKSGKSFVNYGYMGSEVTIRLVILNHETGKEDVDRFFDNLISTGRSIDK